MARTKKQTIDAASARKRQIQEEILNESLALLGKRKNAKSSSGETTNQNSAVSKSPGNAESSRESSVSRSSDSSGICKSSENCVDFPKAVICITDIYKSSPELLDSASVRLSKDISSSRSHGSLSLKPGYEDLKQSIREPMDKKSDMKSARSPGSVKSKPASATTSDQSSRKDRKSSPLTKGVGKQHGRRSPRHQSQIFAGVHSLEPSLVGACQTQKAERPKINIFTDNLGVDLGKRVRSPRRLSEDMIALPIFSVRRTGSTLKDNFGSLRGQDSDTSAETSSKKLFVNGSQPGTLCGKSEKHFDGTPSLELNSLVPISTSPKEMSVKKSKFQSNKGPLGQTPQRPKALNDEGNINCDNHEDLSSVNNGNQNVKFLMSSICKDIIGEVTSERGHLFQRVSKKRGRFNKNLDIKNNINKRESVEISLGLEKDSNKADSFDGQDIKDLHSMEHVQSLQDKISNKDQPSSLLCAMLVGGTDVAQSYSQKKGKLKPEVSEISNSDSESEAFKDVHPVAARSNCQEMKNENFQSCVIKIEETHEKNVLQRELLHSACHEMNQTNENFIDNVKVEIDSKDGISEETKTQLCTKEDKENELPKYCTKVNAGPTFSIGNNDASQCFSDSSPEGEGGKDSSDWKTSKIDLSSQLKKLNENILKLVDIDVEDEFMISPDKCDLNESTQNQTETCEGTKLYGLILALGLRLKEDHTDNPITSQCNVDKIDELIQTCPKNHQQIVSPHDNALWKRILERLKEEENKCDKAPSDSLLSSSSDGLIDTSEVKTIPSNDFMNLPDGDEHEPESLSQQKDRNVHDNPFSPEDKNTQCMYSASSSSLNGSLCELDVDAMTSAAALALKVPSSPSTSTSLSKIEKERISEDPLKLLRDITAKRPLHKALTCSDFSVAPEMKVLRRVNSSPQLFKVDQLPSSSSFTTSYGEGEGTSKSKLGNKIPIPGSIVMSKAGKKSWRTPRIIMNPKPLQILLQFETSDQMKDVFVSSDLQKYLWMPSSRMIVTPAIREEIKRADETAKHAWEAKMLIMKEEEDGLQKKDDEEINQHFSQHEPDFDEVEGMLFMSFSNEIELKAHMHVERALEWDRDDTMLRISRAKIFEETKAVNGDMKDVKMKHLRGQHMRWKKYKRMYSKEVNTLLEAKERGIPLDQISSLRKTSDVTKIKGWKNKPGLLKDGSWHARERKKIRCDVRDDNSYSSYGQSTLSFEQDTCANVEFITDEHDLKTDLDERKRDLSPRSRRRFNFSDRKAHRQLFKELKMDWEDRMIHRKLGGWSLKGNRPKAFSRAAIKRQKRELKDSFSSPMPDGTSDLVSDISTAEPDMDLSPGAGGNLTPRRKKLVYPLLTERMARNCLQTLETGDILRALRRKKKKRQKRDVLSNLPSLTPMSVVINQSPLSQTFSSPSVSVVKGDWSSSQEQMTSTPSVTTPLNLDLPDETVLEGVDIASRVSSPSVTDVQSSPQVKACSKPGCRYGCICHLCSASESMTPPESSLSKTSVPACDKEYCRLGCICDSLDPEQPTPSQSHCGKPSCMLECVCSNVCQVDGSDDIPFLPSMKQRPRVGERFSNLPRREKTHRSAKNLDAVTRKAMMLYETSEIYCEKVERARKRESSDSPKIVAKTDYPLETFPRPDLELFATDERSKYERPFLQPTEISVQKRRGTLTPEIEINDVVQALPNMEPSAHKRKRKSHPLSSEIFTFSSCARIQPYVSKRSRVSKFMAGQSEQPLTSSAFFTGSSNYPNSQGLKMESFPRVTGAHNLLTSENTPDLKIFNVTSLAPTIASHQQSEKVMADLVDLTTNKDTKLEHSSEQTVKPPAGLIPLSKIQESGKRSSSCSQGPAVEEKSYHGWHSSMVCLKAKAPSKNEVQNEDDVQEEDEVKLLEFAADCNWDGSKRAILAQVAGCLTRGHYPQPRTMNIGEFVVEILPKAQQPTVIPPKLRAKLPEQMYSIRVRITRLNNPSKMKLSSSSMVSEPMIDLSVPSPTKQDQYVTLSPSVASSSHLPVENSSLQTSSSSSSSSSLSSSDIKPFLSNSLSTTSSHIGISGLSHVCVSSSSKPSVSPLVKSSSAPGSRRSSFEMFKHDRKLNSADDASLSGVPPSPLSCPLIHSTAKCVAMKAAGRSVNVSEVQISTGSKSANSVKSRIQNSSSLLSTSSNVQKNFPPLVQPVKLLSPSSSLLKRATMVTGSSSKIFQPFTSVTANAANSVLKSVSSKDIKYVQLPNKEPLMVYEVDVKTDKKTLIAVPLSLAGKSGDMKGKPILTVPIPTSGQQKVLPLLASRPKAVDETSSQIFKMKNATCSSQPLLVKIPHVKPSVIASSEQTSKPHGLIHLVPVTLQSNSLRPVTISKPISASSKSSKPVGKLVTSSSNEDKKDSLSQIAVTASVERNLHTAKLGPSQSTTVTQSRDRPISSSEVSPGKKDSRGVDDSSPQSALYSNSSSETEKSQDKMQPKEGSICEITAPVSNIPSKHSHKVLYDEANKERSDDKISTAQPMKNNIEIVDQQENEILSGKETSSVNQVFSPIKDATTCASSHLQTGTGLPVSSSFSQSEPICDGESFNGFSVVKDISYPIISEQDETSSESGAQITDHSFHKHKTKEHAVINTIPFYSILSHNLGSTASNLKSPNNAAGGCVVSSPQSVAQNVAERVLVSSAKALKRSAEDPRGDDISSPLPETKRPRSLHDGPPPGEEDANTRPQSSCSRPKSGLSSVLSSASSEDQVINLSSDEEIDVGDNTPVGDEFSSFKDQMEKAWENDHSSMICKLIRSKSAECKPPSSRPSSGSTGSSKSHFHKYLERARRAKLKELFTQLADIVMSLPEMRIHLQKVTDVSSMPKAMILDCARKSMMHLTHVMNSGTAEINRLEAKNLQLKKELQNVKAELLTRNMSGRAIAAIVNRVSRQARKLQEHIAHHNMEADDEVDGGNGENDEPVNLVSPSTDGEKGEGESELGEWEGINQEESGSKVDNFEERDEIQSQEDVDMNIDVGKHEVVYAGNIVSKSEREDFEMGVSHTEDVIIKETFSQRHGDKSDENPHVSYEDISDWESNTCTNQEPVVQYEDITDDEGCS